MKQTVIIFIYLLTAFVVTAQLYQPTWESLDKRPVPQWFRDSKFGIFIHWGVYAVPGYTTKGNYAEWYQNGLNRGDSAINAYHRKKFGNLSYYQLADQFKAELFRPDEWASVIEKSGAKYIVLTSKHHDGFANWPSIEASKSWGFPWNAVDAGPHRDLLGDLFRAIRKTSVHAGMYYSLYEWFNPIWLKDRPGYVKNHMWPQMKDLINTYKPDVFWTDGEWDAPDTLWKSTEFLAWLYNESPVKDKVVTYDRWGAGIRFHHGQVFTPEYQPDLDFEDHYWEESRGMGFSYGYNREEDAWDYNSSQALVLNLVDKVSRGGNFLLDIGPDEHGKIPPIMEERLLQIGQWLQLNNESIYNTVRWRTPCQWSAGRKDYKPRNSSGDLLLKLTVDPDPGYAVKECFFTYNAKENNLFAILPKWPGGNQFLLNDVTLSTGAKIVFLGTGRQLQWEQKANDILIHFPEFDPATMAISPAYVIKIYNTGAFAPKTNFKIIYRENELSPVAVIDTVAGINYRYTLDGSVPDEHAAKYTGPVLISQKTGNKENLKRSTIWNVRSFKNGLMPGNIGAASVSSYEWRAAIRVSKPSPGISYSYFELSPKSVDDLKGLTPRRTGIRPMIMLNDTGKRENIGLIYEGFIKMPINSIYAIYLNSDDGSKLWIDDILLIDHDGLHNDGEKSATVALKKGYHKIRLAYIKATGGVMLNLEYSSDGINRRPIPAGFYFHEKVKNEN